MDSTILISSSLNIWQFFAALSLGIGLSAAVGFRIFIPFFICGIFARADLVDFTQGFQWMGSTFYLTLFGIASLVEVMGYLLPWVDNLLDIIALPTATVSGIIMTISCLDGIDPSIKWILSIIAGGGIAFSTQLGSTFVRTISSATSVGLVNPFFSLIEDIISIIFSLLAIFFPILALSIVGLLMYFLFKNISKLKRKFLKRRREK